MTVGYSGTPLAKKLSLKDGMRVWRDGMPDSVADRAFEIIASSITEATGRGEDGARPDRENPP